MKKHRILFAAIACLAFVGVGCGNATPVEEVNDDGIPQYSEETANIKVGVMVPLSGDKADYGVSVQAGIELAKDFLGLNHVELIYEDSKCSEEAAVTSVNKLISVDKVHAIIGELCSRATLAAAPIAEASSVVMISPGSSAPKITDAGEYIFRVVPSDTHQGAFGAKLIADKGFKKLAVLYTNNDYGVGFNEILKNEFAKNGGKVVASESVETTNNDVRAELTNIKSASPDAIYIVSNSPSTAASTLKQIKDLNITAQVFASEGLKSDDIITASEGGAEGIIITAVSGGSAKFLNEHHIKYGTTPGPFSAQGHDALQALGWAAAEGAGTGEQLKYKLLDAKFDGASGVIEFDSNGDVEGSYDVYTVTGGVFVKK
jgi:branched-chain amino acid transport system substrate-binding protein